MPTIEQKFATFVSLLSPEEQRAVAPLMKTFAGALGGPQPGGEPKGLPPPPPAGTEGALKPPPPSAIPGGPPLPPPDPMAMNIGRQMY